MASSSRWGENTTLKFVQEYRLRECLWNTKSDIYKNRNARKAAFQEIQEIMEIEGFGVPEIKNKIKALRSTYSQELKKIKDSKKSGAGTDSVYVPHVKWFLEMHAFLRCLDNKRATHDNLTQETLTTNEASDSSDHETAITHVGNGQSPPRGSSSDSATPKTPRLEAPAPPKRKKSNMQQVSAALKDLKQITCDVTKEPPTANEFVIFGNSVTAQLQKLTTVNALLAQAQIQSVLTEFRVAEIQSVSATPVPRVEDVQHYTPTPTTSPSLSYSDSNDSQFASTAPCSHTSTSYHQMTGISKDTNIVFSDIVSRVLSDAQLNE